MENIENKKTSGREYPIREVVTAKQAKIMSVVGRDMGLDVRVTHRRGDQYTAHNGYRFRLGKGEKAVEIKGIEKFGNQGSTPFFNRVRGGRPQR